MRTTRRLPLIAAALALIAGSACATGGGGRADSVWREDMGRLLAGPLAEAQVEFWNRHQVPLERREQDARRVSYQSIWIPRDPTRAEMARGVYEAQNRLTIRGRLVEQALDPEGSVFRVTWEVENQVRSDSVPAWHPAPIPEAAKDRFRPLLSDLRLELRTGVRR